MLNSSDIEQELERQGFSRVPGKEARIHEFKRGALKLYVKTPSKKSKTGYVSKAPLVIHPKHMAQRTELKKVAGVEVNWDARYNNSNLRAFPKHPRPSSGDQYYGYAVDVASLESLVRLLEVLTGGTSALLTNPLDDIDAASDLPEDPTQRKTLIEARIGQGQFRRDLIDYWGQCAVTGLDEPLLLRASHIKPWAKSDNRERLEPCNGLLLSANLDAAFDAGLISFASDGRILISSAFTQHAAAGIETDMRLRKITTTHAAYLAWHRDNVFKGKA
ncbi:MAG: HNH endonuclease [Salinisphaeraceae bacterium]|jgi:hypothetical protein|nr:HNH endonuclease [Salinisphaeraceae bacterium]